MGNIIRAIKHLYPDCAITLSLGERSYRSYKELFAAGADRYLLRHETADSLHYSRLHPPSYSLAVRQDCLYDLKSIGYQVGSGFMVITVIPSPQTLSSKPLCHIFLLYIVAAPEIKTKLNTMVCCQPCSFNQEKETKSSP